MSALGDWRGLVDRLLGRDRSAMNERTSSPIPSPDSRDRLIDRIHDGIASASRSAEEELRRRDRDELTRLDATLATEAAAELLDADAGSGGTDVSSFDFVASIEASESIDAWTASDQRIDDDGEVGERVDDADDGFFQNLVDQPFDIAARDDSPPGTSDRDDPLDEVVVDGTLDADEHAWNLATAMWERGIWKDDDLTPLVEILTDSSNGQRRRALMRQLERGAEPETLRIAHLVRSRWNDEYGHGRRRHLSWDAAVDLAAAFAGHPSVDEALCHLAAIHETYERVRWYEPGSYGGFSPFVEIMVATASSDGGRLLADGAVNRASGGWTLA